MSETHLPEKFLVHMKRLFDILDAEKTGYVKIADIETRWQLDGTEDPACLPPSVLESLRKVTPTNGKLSFERFVAGLKIALLRSSTLQPVKSSNKNIPNQPQTKTAAVPPNNTKTRWLSSEDDLRTGDLRSSIASSEPVLNQDPARWQMSLRSQRPQSSSSSLNQPVNSDLKQAKEQSQSSDDIFSESSSSHQGSAVDFNLIKRIKQWEKERDVLLSGLAVIDNAREWYMKQLSEVELRQSSTPENNSENTPQMLDARIKRIRDVNQVLQHLTDDKPIASNPPPTNNEAESNLIKMLKEQNRMLTLESAEKSEKLTQLEKEKAQLILEIFKASSNNASKNYDDMTFI